MLLFLILGMLSLNYLGLGARANRIIAIVLLVVGALIVFAGWNGDVRLDVD